MLRKTLLAIIFVLAAATAGAQSQQNQQDRKGTIRGTVVDAVTGQPLVGTTIVIEGTTSGTVADAEGGFVISNITSGRVTVTARYLGYEVFRRSVDVAAGGEITLRVPLHSEGISLENIVVVAQIDNESENAVLSGQREALAAIQSVGAAEMSRKGIGDAQAAVAQVSGVSRQEGVKNVFVRGLGDRYNATRLNGFPLPSEDPEYKNIALEFFGSDVIQSIGVSKAFGATNGGDVAGAVIDIRSKELIGARALSLSVDGGINTEAAGAASFLRDGVSYLGHSNPDQPTAGRFDFPNRLDPTTVRFPLNHSYGVSGGRRWLLGEKQQNPLSFFVVGSHTTDYSFTGEEVRKGTADGENITQDQRGEKSSIGINQLVLGNARLRLDRRHEVEYNFMMVHDNDQYVGQYEGYYYEVNQGTDNGGAFVRRQQSNDNLLLVHQLSTRFELSDRWAVDLGAAYNTIAGLEPDRRENYLSLLDDGRYVLSGGNRQKRFFSRLDERDLNLRASVSFLLRPGLDMERSNVTLGYRGRVLDDGFRATEYNIGATSGFFDTADLRLDGVYNDANFAAGLFPMERSKENRYDVTKRIHSAYMEATHQLTERLAGSVGVQVDMVDMTVDYDVDSRLPGTERIDRPYLLPSFNLRYDIAEEHSLRLGLSRSYTLPQSKEIAPYQYINIGFASEGNPDLKPSDNYNADLKWDWYPSGSELVSVGVFYKRIADPIGRVDIGGSAGLLSYDNIAPRADVAGVELEMRKNLLNTTTIRRNMRRLSVGLNASWIHSALEFTAENTAPRRTGLEGASPWLVNGDVSYNWSSGGRAFNLSVVAGWFSDRVHTLGTRGYRDTVEEGVVSLSAVSSYRFGDRFTVRLSAGNLLDPAHRLTRAFVTRPGALTLGEYRNGVDLSVGVSFDLW
ncbi:MAG: TonB-dependent receptor [Alistipes sp.]|jgi:outer membrane receptor protein involved in Fe transport|nr:TonB-dependent receptor [Alistipes sp.]